jgi:hypothetical protein
MLRGSFGGYSLSQTVVIKWWLHFAAGRASAEVEEHSGWPSTSKIENAEKIQELIHTDSQDILALSSTIPLRHYKAVHMAASVKEIVDTPS